LFTLLFLGIFSYNRSSSAIKTKISTSSLELIKQLRKNITIEIDKFLVTASSITLNVDIHKALMDYDNASATERYAIESMCSNFISSKFMTNHNIRVVALISANNNVIQTGYGLQGSNGRDYVKKFQNELKTATSENPVWAIVHDQNGNRIVFIKRITNLQQSIGYLLIEIDEKWLSDIFKDINIGDDSGIFILNSQNRVVSTNDPDSVLFNHVYFNRSQRKIMPQGQLNGTFMLKDGLVAFSAIERTDWTVFARIPFSYLNSESNGILWVLFLVGFLCLILSGLLSFLIASSISVPLKSLVNLMNQAKDGNLAIDFQDEHGDEISEVIESFKEMMIHIRDLISEVHITAQNVVKNANQLNISSEQTYRTAEQVALSIQEIASGAVSQNADAMVCVNNMDLLSQRLNKVGYSIESVSQVVTETQCLSEQTLKVVKTLNDKTLETDNVSHNIIDNIVSLNGNMKQIEEIVTLIYNIAEQTNLLALNAAIEAARAGEAGRGFAVVSDEVNNLAAQSRAASQKISRIIGEIQKKTKEAVTAADNASAIINQQVNAVRETDAAFKTIFGGMEDLSRQIDDVAASVRDILESKDKTLNSIQNISAVTEQSAAMVEEVTASSELQMGSAKELSGMANDLNEMALELNNAVLIFKT
jgi:methyl-accepting chemotaxis protein